MTSILYTDMFLTTVSTQTCYVTVNITPFYAVIMTFNISGYQYRFFIDVWQNSCIWMFLLLFHSHEVRDVGTYGSITIINGVVNYNISEDQRLQCIIQACREIMIYIDMLTKLFGRSTLSYAVWYVNEGHKLGIHMNNNNYNETYSDFISLITCRQITATQFILPNVTWQIVRFVSVKK